MYHLTKKVFSCNGKVKGWGDNTYKCMNPNFHVVNNGEGEPISFICDACHKEYTIEELYALRGE